MHTIPSVKGFLGLEDETSYQNAKVVVVPFGLEASVSYEGGTKNGPQAIITASHQVELFDEELWCEPYQKFPLCTLTQQCQNSSLVQELNRLTQITTHIIEDGKLPLTFGGEHSITPGIVAAFAKKHEEITLLHFDAHADLREEYEGEPNSHACAIRRCLDNPNVSVVSFGIRNISASEIPFLEANPERIKINWAKDKHTWNLKQNLELLRGKNVYITFDVDGLDSSIMPATGTPEPGGLFWNETLEIIKAATQVSNVVGMDINELAPKEGLHACSFLAAKLAYKMLAYKFCL